MPSFGCRVCTERRGSPVAVAVVNVPAPVAAGPDKDAPLAAPPPRHAVEKGPLGQGPGAVHSAAVVLIQVENLKFVVGQILHISAEGEKIKIRRFTYL